MDGAIQNGKITMRVTGKTLQREGYCRLRLVRKTGLEPAHLAALEPKSIPYKSTTLVV
jgi:hypothetical protein